MTIAPGVLFVASSVVWGVCSGFDFGVANGQTVHISIIPISDNNLMCLTLQTFSAFVVKCGDC